MERREFCLKDNILITYNAENVCFEDQRTAEAILFNNDGSISINNFDEAATEYYKKYFKKIYPSVTMLRSLDSLESA